MAHSGLVAPRIIRLLTLLAALATLVALNACTGQQAAGGNAQISLTVAPPHPAVGPADLTISLKDATSNPVSGATVTVEGDMTHGGMVPVQATASDMGGGAYMVKGFDFNMGGDWVLTVNATLPGGSQAQRSFPINGVSGPGPGTPTMEMGGTPMPGIDMGVSPTAGIDMGSTATPGMDMGGMAMPTATP